MHKEHIHVYITDYFNHYVIVMSLTGEMVTKFGTHRYIMAYVDSINQ
jgi:hypothetical protein